MNVTLQLAPGQARRVFAYWHALQADPYAIHPFGKLRSDQDGYDLMEQGPLVHRHDNVWRFRTPEHGVGTLCLESHTLSYDGPRGGIGGPALPLRELFEPSEDQAKALSAIPVTAYITRKPTWAWWETSDDEDPSQAQARAVAQAQVEAVRLVQKLLEARQQMVQSRRATEVGVKAEELGDFTSQMPWDEYAELMANALTDFELDLRWVVEILSAKAGTLTTRHYEIDVAELMQNAMRHSKYAPRADKVWLRADVQADIPTIFGEHSYLQLIINTLVTLAIQRAKACSDVTAQAGYSGERHVFDVSYHPKGSAKKDIEFFSASELFDSADSSGSINWEAFDLVYARSQVSYRKGDFGAAATPEGGVRVWFTWPCILNQRLKSDQRAGQP